MHICMELGLKSWVTGILIELTLMMFFSWSDPRRASLTCTPVPAKYALVSSSWVSNRPCHSTGNAQQQVCGLTPAVKVHSRSDSRSDTVSNTATALMVILHRTVVLMHEKM